MRVEKRNFGHGQPNRITGPSTIHTSSATRFSVLIGA
jgi:hypothetical protein